MAATILADVATVRRFATGQRHFVYEAVSHKGDAVVVRASRREDVAVARNALYWSAQLRPRDLPLPEVLHADLSLERHPFPFVVLERLPGRDLGDLVGDLPQEALVGLARRLSALQAIVTALPLGQGYGFTPRLDGPFPNATWSETIAGQLARSRRRIRDAAVVSESHADRVESAAALFQDTFATVQPVPFLHDITTKNVIVDGERLSGIVDVDDVCFGDPLFLVALIRVALLANGRDPAYADAWLDILRPDEEQRAVQDFYVALFSLDFMAELGHRFNKARPDPVETTYVERLSRLLEAHLPG